MNCQPNRLAEPWSVKHRVFMWIGNSSSVIYSIKIKVSLYKMSRQMYTEILSIDTPKTEPAQSQSKDEYINK